MNSSSHHGTETGSEQAERQEQPQRQHEQHQGKTVCLNTFDLAKIGVSSTLAVAVFILVGYVVRQIAGPSTILSVLIAALIAFLAGEQALLFHSNNFFRVFFSIASGVM